MLPLLLRPLPMALEHMPHGETVPTASVATIGAPTIEATVLNSNNRNTTIMTSSLSKAALRAYMDTFSACTMRALTNANFPKRSRPSSYTLVQAASNMPMILNHSSASRKPHELTSPPSPQAMMRTTKWMSKSLNRR